MPRLPCFVAVYSLKHSITLKMDNTIGVQMKIRLEHLIFFLNINKFLGHLIDFYSSINGMN